VSTAPKQRRPIRRKPARPVAAIVEAVPAEIEHELVDRIARFLLLITEPNKQPQPHSPS
jgi:hypothetical protein